MQSIRLLISFILISGFINCVQAGIPHISVDVQPVSCNGGSDGALRVNLTNITEPHILKIVNNIRRDTSHYSINADWEIMLEDLPGGLIQLSLFKEDEAVASTSALIIEPEPLKGGKINVEQAPSDRASCNGILSVAPAGGNPPYTYVWSENAGNATTAMIEDICMGIYRCEITDSKQCGPVHVSIPLFENTLNSEKK